MNATASALPRVLNCPTSAALPQVSEPGTRYADLGTLVHAFILRARAIGADQALEEISYDAVQRAFCEQLKLDEIPAGGRFEVAIAWDSVTDTSRVLFEGEGRDYARYNLKPTEWVGKLDLMGAVDGLAYDEDWKTGFLGLGPAAEYEQLLFGALATARLIGADGARVALRYLREDGGMYVSRAELDSFDLAAFAERLRESPGRILATREQLRSNLVPEVSVGSWCRYCPAKPFCPAKVSLARSMSGEIVTLRDQLGSLAPVDAGKVYARAKEIIDMAKYVVASVEDLAHVQEIPLPDGDVLREVDVKWPTTIDANLAEDAILAEFGGKVAQAAIAEEKLTTIKAITEALRAVSPRGTLKKNVERAMGAIRKAGGLREGSSPGVRKVKA